MKQLNNQKKGKQSINLHRNSRVFFLFLFRTPSSLIIVLSGLFHLFFPFFFTPLSTRPRQATGWRRRTKGNEAKRLTCSCLYADSLPLPLSDAFCTERLVFARSLPPFLSPLFGFSPAFYSSGIVVIGLYRWEMCSRREYFDLVMWRVVAAFMGREGSRNKKCG